MLLIIIAFGQINNGKIKKAKKALLIAYKRVCWHEFFFFLHAKAGIVLSLKKISLVSF